MRDKVAHLLAALTMRTVVPQRFGEVAVGALERHELLITGKRLAVSLDELGFVIKGVHLA
jgi:hypothetical protein